MHIDIDNNKKQQLIVRNAKIMLIPGKIKLSAFVTLAYY